MDFVSKDLDFILKEIRKLKSKIRSLQKENENLKKENDLLKSEAESLRRQLDDRLHEKAGDLFANEFVGRFRTNDAAKQQINRLISLIDKILTNLKYGQ